MFAPYSKQFRRESFFFKSAVAALVLKRREMSSQHLAPLNNLTLNEDFLYEFESKPFEMLSITQIILDTVQELLVFVVF